MIAGKPELFRGPLEHNGRQINMFEQIIEARYIRFEPQTWKHAIALKFDLFSCDIVISTPRPGLKTTTPRALVPVDECRDQMGLENNEIKDHQITFSSVKSILADKAPQLISPQSEQTYNKIRSVGILPMYFAICVTK